MTEIDVLVIGRNCLDHIAIIEHYPEEDTKIPIEFKLIEAGGQGGTAACCIARLGGNVAYVGRIGDDEAGRFCSRRLADFGVTPCRILTTSGEKTPTAYILVTKSSGNRTIFYEASRLPKISAEDIPPQWLIKASVLLLDPEVTYLAETLFSGSGKKPLIVYDCERWREGLEAMMSVADFFIPSFDFFRSGEFKGLTNSDTEALLKLKRRIKGELIVTCGSAGAMIVEHDTLIRIPAPAVAVKDTIGAGDNFHAAFSLAVSRGLSLIASVKLAVSAASLSCTAYGGKAGIPTWEQAWRLSGTLTEERTAIQPGP